MLVLLLLVPRKGCSSWLWHVLGDLAYIFYWQYTFICRFWLFLCRGDLKEECPTLRCFRRILVGEALYKFMKETKRKRLRIFVLELSLTLGNTEVNLPVELKSRIEGESMNSWTLICIRCLVSTVWILYTSMQFITKTCLYNFDPRKPHFYIVKLGFTRVYIIFSYFCS